MSSSKKHGSLMKLKPHLPQIKMTKPVEEVERLLLSVDEPIQEEGAAALNLRQNAQSANFTADQTNVHANVKPTDQGNSFIAPQPPNTSSSTDSSPTATIVKLNKQTKNAATVEVNNQSSQESVQANVAAEASNAFPDPAFIARIKRTREPITFVGFKIPADLKEELESVARFNKTDMTKIVVEGLRLILPHLPHPPR